MLRRTRCVGACPIVVAPTGDEPSCYRECMRILGDGAVPFLVGGAVAVAAYTGVRRGNTKDLDLFVRDVDLGRALVRLASHGFRTETPYPHWLAKAYAGEHFVDVIYNSGNGVAPVDPEWFAHAPRAVVLDTPVSLCPAEETLWSKAFVMERERFDGADVLHLLLGCGDRLDWRRLLRRFGEHWRVLLSHLVLFGFAFPDEGGLVPAWLLDELTARLRDEPAERRASPRPRVCKGTLLSREQYLPDVARGWRDARLPPTGSMSSEQIAVWTRAIGRMDPSYRASAQQRNPVE